MKISIFIWKYLKAKYLRSYHLAEGIEHQKGFSIGLWFRWKCQKGWRNPDIQFLVFFKRHDIDIIYKVCHWDFKVKAKHTVESFVSCHVSHIRSWAVLIWTLEIFGGCNLIKKYLAKTICFWYMLDYWKVMNQLISSIDISFNRLLVWDHLAKEWQNKARIRQYSNEPKPSNVYAMAICNPSN